MANLLERNVERLVFWSRWLQAPLYLGLIAAQVLYCWKFLQAFWHLAHEALWPAPGALSGHTADQLFITGVLGLIDIVMVANLITMVVIGGYATFVSKLDLDEHADRPDWLEHIDPGAIKVKLAGSLIGVSGVHLLQSFVAIDLHNAGKPVPAEAIKWQIVIHITFLLSAVLLAFTEMIMHRRQRAGEGHGTAAGATGAAGPVAGH